ncbi:MAG TPA: replicative DNA helicase [Coxiellaceae bacterium]|nr:replicative DNA helicase [Coxiellaceae bacterium]
MKTAAPKIPPQSKEAEQSVLGALFLDHRVWDSIADRILPADFYHKAHQYIFEAVAELVNRLQPIDVLTVSEALKAKGQLEMIGGETYLYELAKNTPTATNAKAYADIVHQHSVLRQLIETGSDIAQSAFNPNGRDTKALLDEAEQRVFHIAEQHIRGTGPQPISHLLTQATERIDTLYHSKNALAGLGTGFKDLDEMTSGLQKGDLIIVAGRPSMGKTAFAMNIAESVGMRSAHDKSVKPVLIFSMEMPAESLAMRMISSMGRIDQHRIRTGKLHDEDWPRVSSAVSMLSEAKMYIDDTPALTPTEIRSRARRLAREHGGLSLIMVDYLQLMQVPGYRENRTMEISEISRALKTLAKELTVPVMALSQLNRSLEQRHNRRPIMSDLRESGSIEQDADVIAFIYRDEVYNEDSADKGVAEIIIGKQRNGPVGKLLLTFLGQYTKFESFTAQSVPMGDPFGDDR